MDAVHHDINSFGTTSQLIMRSFICELQTTYCECRPLLEYVFNYI
jgi:hypothetical protein